MGGFYISKAVVAVCSLAAVAAVATIIALSVVYVQEKSKNEAATDPTVTPDPSFTTATTPSTPKEPWQRYRLPDSLAPVSYNVTLWPHMVANENGTYVFSGKSTVIFKCIKETDLIIIHSNKLNLIYFEGHLATLKGLDGATAPALKKTWLEVPTQYLVIQLQSALAVGSSYELHTEFVGELANDLGGFYRSEYYEDGVEE